MKASPQLLRVMIEQNEEQLRVLQPYAPRDPDSPSGREYAKVVAGIVEQTAAMRQALGAQE